MPFKSHFGMSRNPFHKEDIHPREAYESIDHLELQSGLAYLTSVKGIGVVTAPSGYGKTFAIRCFMTSLDPKNYSPAYICLSTVSVSEFYKELCRGVGVERKNSKTEMFHSIREQIKTHANASKRPFIIIVDEAQELSTHILRELKMLTNFHYDSRYFFTLILCGTSDLLDHLNRDIHEALRQRIVYHYSLEGLADDEVREYVRHKIDLSGASHDIITEDALNALIGGCGRKVRIIDSAMNAALLIAAQKNKACIDAPVMQGALESLSLI